jgi:hypothetical protein
MSALNVFSTMNGFQVQSVWPEQLVAMHTKLSLQNFQALLVHALGGLTPP